MFIDHVKIEIKAGDGGNGAIAFHREKYVAAGGPAGGDGGLEVLDLVQRDRERVVLALVRVLEVVVDGGGPVLAHVLVGGDRALDRRRQGGDLGEDLGAGTRLFR